MNKSVSAIAIIKRLEGFVCGVSGNPESFAVQGLSGLGKETKEHLGWMGKKVGDWARHIAATEARVIICPESIRLLANDRIGDKLLIGVENPKLAVAIVAKEFWARSHEAGIHESAMIDTKAVIGPDCYIGANVAIGECVIGKNNSIYPSVTIYDGVITRDNVTVHAGTVLGVPGLGCERMPDGKLIPFPHFGKLDIGSNVEIGANCQIAIGSLSTTIIGDGAKINGHCFIAHNCIIGANVLMTGNVMIAGSVEVGEGAVLYSGCILRDGIKIGRKAVVGMGSVVVNDVPEGETWAGNPARKMK